MDIVRKVSLLATASLLGIAMMLGWISAPRAVSADAASSLAQAASYFDSTIVLARNAAPRGVHGDELAVSLGYIERLRLGLGSPFRLADEALHDPRLPADEGRRTAWAILDRVRRGDAYVIDPSLLDGSGPWNESGHGASGSAHLALIDRTIRSASDPRAGELAVRLAYLIASAQGALAQASVPIAAQVAALVRDRVSAEADVRDLLADANAQHTDPLELLVARRAARAFRVEQPSLAPLDGGLQIEAMNATQGVVAVIDTLDRATPLMRKVSLPVIGPRFADRLAELGRARPPQAQVVVTLGVRADLPVRATNEEALAAAMAPAVAGPDSTRRASALAVLATAIAVRSLGQQTPWFPGDPGPDATDLSSEFGLANVSFARAVPAAWRPLYLRELQGSLRDVQRVLPTFSMDGLRVHFDAAPLPDSALAMHDPRTRTLQLSIYTSGGTLAHELSHDLDWQASRRLFATGGGYSSDRSMQESRGALAASLRGLAEARLLRPFGAGSAPHAGRPAEVFARGADWFVATSLARRGRMNGYLSAIQDALLPGYAAGQPAALGTAAVQSLTSALDAMIYLPDSVRSAFESQWSDPRAIDPVLLLRRALETPVWTRGGWAVAGDEAIVASLVAVDPVVCASDASPALQVRERLLMTAIDARATGAAMRRARYQRGDPVPAWANSLLHRAPWAPETGDRVVDRLRAVIAADLANALPDQGVMPAVPAIFQSDVCPSDGSAVR